MPGRLKYLSERWFAWRHQSVNHRIFSATLTIGLFTLLGKLFAILKELVTAYNFGTSDVLDAFIIAFLLPAFIINVFSNSLRTTLIPVLTRIHDENNHEETREFLSEVLFLTLIGLIAGTILLALSSPYVIQWFAYGFSNEKLILTKKLLFLLLPILILSTLSAIWGAILNTHKYFSVVAVAPALIHLFAIVLLMLSGEQWGIYALATGTVIGFTAEFLVLTFVVRHIGLAVFPRWHGVTAPVKAVFQQFMPMAAGMILMSSTILVDQVMAATLEPGSVSILNYAGRIIALLTGVGAMALGTAIFPYFSKQAAENDWGSIRHTLIVYARLILITTIPLTILIIYFSYPLIELIFERGSFEASDTQRVAHVQIFYLFQIPFFVLGVVCARVLNALSKNQVLMAIGFSSLIINVAGNFILMEYLGVAGIALSTSIIYLTSLIIMIYYINKFTRIKSHQNNT